MYILPLLFFCSNYRIVGQQITTTTPITTTVLTGTKTKIRVGICAVETVESDVIGWPGAGGAVNFAISKLADDGYISMFDFEFFVNYTECDRALGAAIGMDFMRSKQLNVVVGPPCADPMEVMAAMSSYYKIPVLGWGLVTASTFTDSDRYPYLSNIVPNTLSMGYSLVKLLEIMDWDRIALLYEASDQNYGLSVINDIETALNDETSYSSDVVVKQELPSSDNNDSQYTTVMKKVKSSARIVISSIQTATARRKYLKMAMDNNMTTTEYVHIMVSARSVGLGKQSSSGTKCELTCLSSGLSPFWEAAVDDGYNSQLREAARRVFALDLSNDVSDQAYLTSFTSNVTKAVTQPPISCQTAACSNVTNPAAFARSLHDTIYLYGMALTNMYNKDPNSISDVDALMLAMQTSFDGLTGEVLMNSNNSRIPKFMFYGLDSTYDETSYMNLTYTLDVGSSISKGYTDESVMWYWYSGVRPLATPICGFAGTSCPKTFMAQYGALVIVLSAAIVAALIIILCCGLFLLRQRKLEQDRINAEWQIPFMKLQKPPKRDKERQSKRSLQSGPSTITETSKFSFDSDFSNYTVYYLDKDPVLTTKHPASTLTKQEYEVFVKLRKLDHDNINKFIGMSIDGAEYIAVWKMCMRGSLQDIIVQGNFSIDPFFMFCIIRDIAEGLKYIHSSFLHVHGNLRSATCLVNDSWQAKITDYGIGFLMEENKPMKKRQLWMAPEVLRGALLPDQIEKPADIYSFAIICSEILTRKPAWNLAERKEGVDELIYSVKKGGMNAIRPELDLDGVEVSNNLLHLVRDCWSDEPQDRPTSDAISSLLRNMMPSKKTNLMDHVFNILEEYTTTLELEVEERTKELSAEKKKADVLLGRMLPKQVAERLKAGQTVEPEGFDSVTVMFSDVVKFTQLAAKCSPFQVVNLLNDLYGNFDAIIEEHGVYKVESIGDGYLCVSGLPVRNGFQHIKQVVELSLDFMSYCLSFKVPHLPREKVELRIGVNSGPCVAGVVGLSMPRYCLFGDTVNTASRMESNGKASHVHMSSAAHTLLLTHYKNQYETQSRGDVIIKGKGVMETFWVHGRTGEYVEEPKQHPVKPESPPELKPQQTPPIRQRRPITPRGESPTMSKRSVSPIVESKLKQINDESEALYRQFRRSETLALM